MVTDDRTLPSLSSGDDRFDTILGGGIPTQSVVVITGEPGSGKTVLTMQMLFRAAREGHRCLYFTTISEPAIKVIRYMQLFDFYDESLIESSVIFSDLASSVGQAPEQMLAHILASIDRWEPTVLVVDSFRAIVDLMPNIRIARAFVYELAIQLSARGITTLLVGEYTSGEFADRAEFAVADGIIRLDVHKRDLAAIRELEVLKLRGRGIIPGKHFFDISTQGVFVYPRVQTPQVLPGRQWKEIRRVATGTAGLDHLLGGGVPAGSATVLQGPTGTGKTIVALQFLIEGARRGERGVMFTLEETPDQLRAIAFSLGWDLAGYEQEGLLLISYASPVELSTDRYLQTARDEIRERRATRAVFDSLTSMALSVSSDRRFKELVYAVGKHMRLAGVTLMMTLEAGERLGSSVVSPLGVSFIADNLIQLRYVDVGDYFERGIAVVKARGVKHQTDFWKLEIDAGGPRVSKRGTGAALPARRPTRQTRPAPQRRSRGRR